MRQSTNNKPLPSNSRQSKAARNGLQEVTLLHEKLKLRLAA